MSGTKYAKHADQGPLLRESVTRPHGSSAGASAPPALHEQLNFSVQYGLPEYVSFMWQHAGFLIRRRRIGMLASYWLLSKSTSAAMHFVLQGRSRRMYDFTVDEHGIIRACGTGVTLVPWADVQAIRRYSRGFLLVLLRGTLPIPYRCLSASQTAVMDAITARLR
jgi:hypothetical protein